MITDAHTSSPTQTQSGRALARRALARRALARRAQAKRALRRGVRRPLAAVAGVALVGLIAAACGSSTPNATAKSTTTTAAAPAGATGGAATAVVEASAVSNAKIGSSILVNSAGMTLYKFSADSAGMSACTGSCASAWPPLTVASGATPKGGSGATGAFGTITRSDGTRQVTYNGDPLYTFSGDSTAGETNGQNITSDGGTWTVVTVGAATMPATTKATTTTKPTSGGGYGY
jgi:predicted lipoprotein with Yx(FWY)xxD motif